MALTYSEPVKLGMRAPEFPRRGILGTDGKNYHISDFSSAQVLVVVFMCNHCPYVQAIRPRIRSLEQEFRAQGVQVIGINSNDSIKYPDDSYDAMKKEVKEQGYEFPYLFDETQEVAKLYGAVCTPDFFVFDQTDPPKGPLLAYRGRLDDNWKDESQVTRRDLAQAVESLLKRSPLSHEQHSSMGCSIKWKVS
jgi:peroxiredoxin